MRIGLGIDFHRFAPERDLVLGGVVIPHSLGLDGHSDADVLLHAIGDALLGAAALGDIGHHFPVGDPAYAGISSLELLRRTVALLAAAGYAPSQVDAVVVAERPALAPYVPTMQARIAAALGVEISAVSVKATTPERMGALGRGEGIGAWAVALIRASSAGSDFHLQGRPPR
ncbi:MAG TPA: 2-C-methyl-D-erythritol 2,4-cyclodiphosphate synthase [Candidatus Bipolaricaulis sp.]|nr:2-C-methyl-D-erythritol 2,4-cyclodiphosphate synthase [Candidatus Bipolaricaulis sp.]HRS13773.1 2-C-methyl-D-erythritol 2,4-cyclodiphosphate synthase [Candidatus Bipolaricaulis sp.]HRU21519.1 2-C-methyl-D-erythritol 2,4-cyclodiphosphate synthase [Candidatus Bipolaricaulis sp.]